jgi:hypothetical protein
MLAQSGKVQGLQQTVNLLKAIIDDEKKKADHMRVAMASQVSTGPVLAQSSVEVRPPLSIKEQRLAEEEAEKAAEATGAESGPREEEPRADNP